MDHCPGTTADYANDAAHSAKRAVENLERSMAASNARTAAAIAAAGQPGAQHAEIENRFSYHPAGTPERQAQHEAVRDACKKLAHALDRIVPKGRHASLALTAVEEAMHWANAGVACSGPEWHHGEFGEQIVATDRAIAQPGGLAFDSSALNDDVPDGRTWITHIEHPDTVHDVPEHQLDDHLTFDNPLITCMCEPTVEPYSGGLRIVHNTLNPD